MVFFNLHTNIISIKKSDVDILILLVYIDDVLITSSFEQQIHDVKHFLDVAFTIEDLGPAKFFLGLEIVRCSAGISVRQHNYVRDVIHDVNLISCESANTPLPLGVKLCAHDSSPLHEVLTDIWWVVCYTLALRDLILLSVINSSANLSTNQGRFTWMQPFIWFVIFERNSRSGPLLSSV
ncbi:UNVERIFIED_CONTAM: putative mitochondrial protein [Sesamum radiatum]|uniref:Mitochondrial protein n=1 Tax=Sesamum radiatum TaxID=300843 RepID=A0AAW2NRK8_SESRA